MSNNAAPCLVCDCNHTMSPDGAALAAGLKRDGALTVHHELCRHQIGAFEGALAQAAKSGQGLTVGCTQEAPLFGELAAGSDYVHVPIRFVNLRESGGWSAQARAATPKMAALLADAQLPAPAPALGVSYESQGRTLIAGPAADVLAWAERLRGQLEVFVLITEGTATLPAARPYPVVSGRLSMLNGWLGAFEAEWHGDNPIDLDACTRCGACVAACPEQAIGSGLQIDLAKCTGHRACVTACGEVGAIDFARAASAKHESFDMVFDLREASAFKQHQSPQGYIHGGRDPLKQALAALELTQLVGEFDKPKYFRYEARTCAHSRSARQGCNQCIDICSTDAIAADGDHVKVEPHLCMGCGACATVCPSGAMTYAFPQAAELGTRAKTMLRAYAQAVTHPPFKAAPAPTLLLHDAGGRALIEACGGSAAREVRAGGKARGTPGAGRGLPAAVIPLELHHVASSGLEIWLTALAYGAGQVLLLTTGAEAPQYRDALAAQAGIANAILGGLGYGNDAIQCVHAADAQALEAALWSLPAGMRVAQAATYNVSNDKRGTLEFAIDHLARHAPQPREMLPLPAGAPYGAVAVNQDSCTMCLACVGACPASALMDNPQAPQLRFVERNCVQCGLCADTCPEDAITLTPRLNLAAIAKQPVVLNEAKPFYCVRCAKPFGTKQMVDNMVAKLSGHSMFAGGAALKRLQMCADCRVVDMMENKNESTIHDFKR